MSLENYHTQTGALLSGLRKHTNSLKPIIDSFSHIASTFNGLKKIEINIPELKGIEYPSAELQTLGIRMDEPRSLTDEENEILRDSLMAISFETFISAVEERSFEEYQERIVQILAVKDERLSRLYGG